MGLDASEAPTSGSASGRPPRRAPAGIRLPGREHLAVIELAGRRDGAVRRPGQAHPAPRGSRSSSATVRATSPGDAGAVTAIERWSSVPAQRATTPASAEGPLDLVEVDPQAEHLGEAAAPADDSNSRRGDAAEVAGVQPVDVAAARQVGGLLGVAQHHVGAGVDELADVAVRVGDGVEPSEPPGTATPIGGGALLGEVAAAGRPCGRSPRSGRTSRRGPSRARGRARRSGAPASGASRPPAWVT